MPHLMLDAALKDAPRSPSCPCALQPLLSSGRLSELCVVFFGPEGKPLDRVVLQLEVSHELDAVSCV